MMQESVYGMFACGSLNTKDVPLPEKSQASGPKEEIIASLEDQLALLSTLTQVNPASAEKLQTN
jgi:hypothetical protein